MLPHISKAMKKMDRFGRQSFGSTGTWHLDQFTKLPLQQMLRAIKHVTEQETVKVRDKMNHCSFTGLD